MVHYIDGFVIPVPKAKLAEYKKIAKKASRIWKEHGALDYWECAGDDFRARGVTPFPKMAKTKSGETVVFAWIVYKSRAHRDLVNKKVMKDPRIKAMCSTESMPFDARRMAYGGFKEMVRG